MKGMYKTFHIKFRFLQAGTSAEDAQAIGLLAGYAFVLVPTGNALCKEIAQEHRRRFLQNAKITKIVEK